MNCAQAASLGKRVQDSLMFELLAPVTLNIVCFRYISEKTDGLDGLNNAIVVTLKERGIAAPSTTTLKGQLAIRVNITNYRTETRDLDLLLEKAEKIGDALTGKMSSIAK